MLEDDLGEDLGEFPDTFKYFVAGVPPIEVFRVDTEPLIGLIDTTEEDMSAGKTAVDLSIIGLAAYFEAFCKNQFAAAINICPQTLDRFASIRKDAAISLKHLVGSLNTIDFRLGSLMVEGYDFGSARTINSLYNDLLGITPFSKDEEGEYSQFLSDRNLLVHHGGIYTFKYESQQKHRQPINGNPGWHSLSLAKNDYTRWFNFIESIVLKITSHSARALKEYIAAESIPLDVHKGRAIKYLGRVTL
jgi:hypothetical protein